MTVSSSHQMNVFIISILSGVCCGLVFDFQRSLRRVYGAGTLHTAIQDLIFVLVCVATSIGVGFHFNHGEIRYFEIMGVAAGALVYLGTVSQLVLKFLCVCHRAFVKLIIKPVIALIKLLLIPINRLKKDIRKIAGMLKGKIKSRLRIIRSRKKRIKKRIKML